MDLIITINLEDLFNYCFIIFKIVFLILISFIIGSSHSTRFEKDKKRKNWEKIDLVRQVVGTTLFIFFVFCFPQSVGIPTSSIFSLFY